MQEPPQIEAHEKWMHICIQLAKQALQEGNPPVGSLLVKEGNILGEGKEAGKTKKDITCHAEIEAIRDALKNTPNNDLSGSTLYTTHEPCLMCSYVIRHHKVSKVVIGTRVSFIGGVSSAYPLLIAENIPIWTTPPLIVENVLREACQALSQAYEQKKKAL